MELHTEGPPNLSAPTDRHADVIEDAVVREARDNDRVLPGLALIAPGATKSVALLGDLFIAALKAVAPILVFVLVAAAIANHKHGQPTHIRPVLMLYLAGTFAAALVAVLASFAFPTTLVLDAPAASGTPPGGILVADYKTDREVPATAADCNPEYLAQLATYRDALRLAEPGRALRFSNQGRFHPTKYLAGLAQAIVARGACDMKAGLVMNMFVLAAFAKFGSDLDAATQRQVLGRIHRVMKDHGTLFVGHAENFSDARTLFALRGKTVYEKV